MRTAYIILSLAIFIANLSGCGTKPAGQDKILVTVANKFITLKDFKHKISRLPPYYQSIAEKNKKSLLEDMIVEDLFMEDAVRKSIDRDKEVKELLDEAKKKIIIAKLIKTEVDDKVSVSEDEAKNFYEDHKEDFKSPQMWRASHILVGSESDAKNILAELSGGKSFEEIAKERSIDATATRGGDVGYFRKGQVIPEFESTCFSLTVGETSGIVHTQFGYHIIKLTDMKNEVIQPFEEARPVIENEIKLKKRNEIFNKLVADLRDKYRVRYEDDALKVLDAVAAEKKTTKE